jgi:hypothetical protein
MSIGSQISIYPISDNFKIKYSIINIIMSSLLFFNR